MNIPIFLMNRKKVMIVNNQILMNTESYFNE